MIGRRSFLVALAAFAPFNGAAPACDKRRNAGYADYLIPMLQDVINECGKAVAAQRSVPRVDGLEREPFRGYQEALGR